MRAAGGPINPNVSEKSLFLQRVRKADYRNSAQDFAICVGRGAPVTPSAVPLYGVLRPAR
jgi:hypothetical protein